MARRTIGTCFVLCGVPAERSLKTLGHFHIWEFALFGSPTHIRSSGSELVGSGLTSAHPARFVTDRTWGLKWARPAWRNLTPQVAFLLPLSTLADVSPTCPLSPGPWLFSISVISTDIRTRSIRSIPARSPLVPTTSPQISSYPPSV